MIHPDKGKRLSPKKAAEMIGVGVTTLANWRCTKRYDLPYSKYGRVFYWEEEVNKFIEEHSR